MDTRINTPNVIYFVCHDLGRALGSYGAGIPTPNLDRFAAEGVRLTNAHCASPACSPSRACAMTGRYAHTTGALGLSHMGWPLDLSWQTTVDDFNAAGYQTILSGTNHERHPRSDRYKLDLSHDWDDWKLPKVVDNALAALERRDSSRPFYLNIGTQEPHACTWKDVGGRIPELPQQKSVWMPDNMLRTRPLEGAFARFASAVAYLDQEFGRFLQGLKRLGLDRNTLVVFTTDHGISGPRAKGTLYGLGTEIACMFRWPGGLPAGQVRGEPVSNLSFRATLAEAAGIMPVDSPQGGSIWLNLLDGNSEVDSPIFLERNFHGEKPWRSEKDYVDTYDPVRAVRTKDFLYIRNYKPLVKPPAPLPNHDAGIVNDSQSWKEWHSSWPLPEGVRPEEELYDLNRDPEELCNVANDPSYSDILRACQSSLQEWMQQTRDFVPGTPPCRTMQPGWGFF